MAKGTVLVIDDDPFIADFLVQALEDEGYCVFTSVDGEALELARNQHPDLILLDIMMPIMDGVEVGRRLRDNPATADIPIVVMSAQDRLDSTVAHMSIDGQLPKPFGLDHLFSTVARWIRS